MNFVDATLVQLAELATRTPIFDAVALEQISDAAYDTASLQIQGPFQPVFDEFQLGFTVPRIGSIDGSWNFVGGTERYDARFQLNGIGSEAFMRVDALWRGRIVARAVPDSGRIIDVDVQQPDIASIDTGIIADLGVLPDDPDVLEQERRTRLLELLRDAFAIADAANDDLLDRWLQRNGIASVSELVTGRFGVIQGRAVQVTFSPPDAVPPLPVALPITAALLVRDAGFPIAELLMESKMIRDQLLTQGLAPPRDASLPARQQVVVVWIIPSTVFDDDDWPGGTQGMTPAQRRAARRLAAGQWLAREGIGLVAT